MAVPGDIDLRPGQIYHQPEKSGNRKVIYCTDFAHVTFQIRLLTPQKRQRFALNPFLYCNENASLH